MNEIRDKKGQFLPGFKPTEEMIRKNSEAQIRRHKRAREFGQQPDLKRCSRCKEIKRVADEFSMRKRKLKSGYISITPTSECNICKQAMSAKWRAERRAKGLGREDNRRWKANQDPEKLRQYWREYQAIRRRKAGAKVRGPWMKYREHSRRDPIPLEPLQEFITYQKTQHGLTNIEIAHLASMDERRIRCILNPTDQTSITSDVAERIIKAIDPGIHLSEVYPELYSDD